jgi:Leucine-rich repeat (LRR) protein
MKNLYFLLTILAVWTFSLRSNAQVLQADSIALVDFYNAAGGPNWTNQGNWLTGPVNTWSGITVTNGRVTNFSVGLNNMSGIISPSIGQLTELTEFRIQGDEVARVWVDIHGSIPAELWNCTKIKIIQLKFTKITGNIPAGIANMTALTEINFQATYLGCEIPAEIFNLPNLAKAYLHESNFTGTVPATLVNATKLVRLYLQKNKLSGGLPFVNIPATNKAKVELTGNHFTFADVKPYHDAKANYANFIDDYQYAIDTVKVSIDRGTPYTMDGTAAGAEAYAWFKNAETVPVGMEATQVITPAGLADGGIYTCKAQSSMATGCNLLSVYNITVNPSPFESDSLALVDFYNATGGSNWTTQGNWLTGPVSTWTGVTVTGGRVTGLEIVSNNMSGTIPASIGKLTELTRLRLIGDENPVKVVDIHGTIPAELWNCTKINVLQLKFTNLSGNIPEGIEKMVNLSEINFQQSYLGCEIPAALFNLPNLTKAYLHESNFTGAVPASLVNATKLVRLYLQKNKLSAGLPYVNIPATNKAKVELNGNHFTFADLKPYFDSKANYAGFTCDYQYAKDSVKVAIDRGLPYTMDGTAAGAEAYAWFKNAEAVPVGMEATQVITPAGLADGGVYTCKAQSSMATGCNLLSVYNVTVNPTPLELDSLALVEFYNAAGGPGWTNQGNWLTGPVSTWTGITVTDGRVTGLEIVSNNMSGVIPASIGKLTELTRLRLIGDENPVKVVDIHGTIPAELWNCTKIKVLQLKYTNLSGNIPAGIEKMVNLEEINFQQSYLGCEIPEALFNLPKLVKAYLHQSNFTGKVPASLVNATKLTRLYLQGNKLSAGLPYVNIPAANKAKVELNGNYFTFSDLKPYFDSKANYAGFTCDYQFVKDTVSAVIEKGAPYTMDGTAAGAEAYAWFKNAEAAPVGTEATQGIISATLADEGVYTCKAQSSMATGCNLLSVYKLLLNVSALERDSLALVDFYNAAGGPNWTNQGNWLTGPVSTWSGITVTNGRVTNFSVGLNNMSGIISPSIGKLTELTEFRIQGDEVNRIWVDIHGSIPAELWNCNKIKILQLKFTKITGNIPVGIANMTALTEINFQATYLGCEIPAEIFNLPNLAKAYLHESNFTGAVPATLVNATKLVRLYLQKNKLSGGLPYVNIPAENKAKVELTGNYFTFAEVKPYHDAKANYANFIDDYQWAQDAQSITAANGSSVNFKVSVANGEVYNWFKDNIIAPVGSDSVLVIPSVSKADQGVYVCKVQNSTVPSFDIRAIYTLNGGTVIPAFSSATTSVDGKTITLEFDFDMAGSTATDSSFVVKVDGVIVPVTMVISDAANSKKLVLTLGTAIPTKKSAVTVSYIPGILKGSTGGSVAAFGPITVTNLVTTGISQMGITLRTFPNPVVDVLNIQSSAVFSNIDLFDMTGRKIKEIANLSSNSISIQLSDITKGVYILSVKTDKGVFSRRITLK